MKHADDITTDQTTSPGRAPAGGDGALQGVGWRLEQHDRGRIELKLKYDRPTDGKKSRYRVNLYFFVPPNLGIGPRRYDGDDFFEDLQTYTRYLAPTLPLRGLADFEDAHHPLRPILGWMSSSEHAAPSTHEAEKLNHALKLYGAALSEALDDERNFLLNQVRTRGEKGAAHLSPDEIVQRSDRLVEAIELNLSAFRALRAKLKDLKLDPQVHSALDAVDEYLSLEAEETLFKTLILIRDLPQTNGAVVERAKALIRNETEYRVSMGMPSRVSPDREDSRNEAYQYRHGVLKKFAASALFLTLKRSRLVRRVAEGVAAIAAGLAMTFALIVAVLSTRYAEWSIYSTQWIVVAVVAYMCKDRIKEWLRTLGSRQLSRWLADRRGFLLDESMDRRIGIVSETFRYVEFDRLDRTIRKIRTADPLAGLELESGDERILCYTREIELFGNGGPERSLTDILRYDFDRYTGRMDDPLDPVSVLADDGRVHVVMTPRVYHVNMVLRIADLNLGDDASIHAFLRVILTRKGIRRVEFAG